MFNSKPMIKATIMHCIYKCHGNLKIKSHNRDDHPLLYKQAEQPTVSLGDFQSAKMIQIICNMGAHDLLDMYALSPWNYGLRASGMHIRQIPGAHVTTIT